MRFDPRTEFDGRIPLDAQPVLIAALNDIGFHMSMLRHQACRYAINLAFAEGFKAGEARKRLPKAVIVIEASDIEAAQRKLDALRAEHDELAPAAPWTKALPAALAAFFTKGKQ